jgi:3-hydroxyisobutyrate dehydrogenase-like beta-hydroxyacid dehydrogenase
MMSVLKIGWLGLGKMGIPMAANLINAGNTVLVYNRTSSRTQELVEKGAILADTVKALSSESDVVISMISDDDALKSVSFGRGGLFENLKPGAIYIDMSTVSPVASELVATAANKKGIRYLRAPVSGSTALATAGTLTILVSGPQDAYEECSEIFNAMGKVTFYVGGGEEARYLKLVLNMMVGITSAMIGEVLTFGKKGGMDWSQMIDVICTSVVGSPLINYKAQTLKDRNFTPAFTVSQLAKDFDIALDTARVIDAPLPITAQIRQNLGALRANGNGDSDFFAYVTILEQMAGLDIGKHLSQSVRS